MLGLLKRIYESIALLPAAMVLCFIFFAMLLLAVEIDYASLDFLRYIVISEKSDVQFILSFVITGIFTLTIFSYTMVMNVLNRNINNYSPRLIPLLLSEKHHQLILGFTTGTIAYAMIMSVVVNNATDSYFPGIAASVGVLFSIVCILLYIYFLHSVSQSIHVNYIIHEVYKDAQSNLKRWIDMESCLSVCEDEGAWSDTYLNEQKPGYVHFYDLEKIDELAAKDSATIQIIPYAGAFLLLNDELFKSDKPLSSETRKAIRNQVIVDHGVPTHVWEHDIKHLVEVAVKACSPAINDPGTALNAINYMTQAIINRLDHGFYNCYQKKARVFFNQFSVEKTIEIAFKEMDIYMKNDIVLMKALRKSLQSILAHNNIKDKLSMSILSNE